MQVVKCMRDTVNGSNKIKKMVGVLPDKESDFRLPLWPGAERFKVDDGDRNHFSNKRHDDSVVLFHGMRLDTYDGQLSCAYDSRFDDLMHGEPPPDIRDQADFRLICEPDAPCLRKLGGRVGAMFPCQPPRAELRTVFCCDHCGDDRGTCLDLHGSR